MTGPSIILGGAGFVGTNLAATLAERGETVRVFDNLSRAGAERNASWLLERYPGRFELIRGDVRDEGALGRALEGTSCVFHFAAQVAVTSSLTDPLYDFQVNALGTLRVLETLRRMRRPAPLVFTSTNKVYGCLPHIPLVEGASRYEPVAPDAATDGVSELMPLDFHSPYGCSKGAADQYVRDYARCFGLQTTVLRMSCIYGPHQAGNEDQGWVAHFCRSALEGRATTIFGDGKQVRDILFVEDLVEALLLTRENATRLAGCVFNIGGGPANSLSLRELLDYLKRQGRGLSVRYKPWRAGDQRYYASNTSRFREATGWQPRVSPEEGVDRLLRWLSRNSYGAPLSMRPLSAASAALLSSK